jgi:hypothetical protein
VGSCRSDGNSVFHFGSVNPQLFDNASGLPSSGQCDCSGRNLEARLNQEADRQQVQGPPTFHMAFHLPYFAWRTSSEPAADSREVIEPRIHPEPRPLRKTYELEFLGLDLPDSRCFIYEAQISVVIAVSTAKSWVAYVCSESYFDSEENVENYDDDDHTEGSLGVDPGTFGQLQSDQIPEEPRVYFMWCLVYRLRQVNDEWLLVMTMLQKSVSRAEHVYGPYNDSVAEGSSHARFMWQLRFLDLVSKMMGYLDRTIEACEEFLDKYWTFFSDITEAPGYEQQYHQLLHNIGAEITDLKRAQRAMAAIKQKCETIDVKRVSDMARSCDFVRTLIDVSVRDRCPP